VKILVRATNWVGDAIMAIPALQVVRSRWPDAQLTVLARPWVADLYRGQGIADNLIVFESRGRHKGLRGREKLIAELRYEKFDIALLLQNAFEAAWLAWRAGIPERIGYARDRRSWLLTRAIEVPAEGEIPAHEKYYYLELLRRAGWLKHDKLPAVEHIALSISADAREAAAQRLIAAGARPGAMWIAFAPGAAYGSAKCWAPERYASLADELILAYDADVILFGTPQESDMAARIQKSMRSRAVSLVGATQIGELPALLGACRLFVGNDSGAMHVASAAGLPIVGVFGPTDPDGTSPVTPQFALVRQPVACSPCFLRHCPIDHRCMTRISVREVFVAAENFITGAVGATLPGKSAASID
jgi:heptosyltransferase II